MTSKRRFRVLVTKIVTGEAIVESDCPGVAADIAWDLDDSDIEWVSVERCSPDVEEILDDPS